jgi:hypothetical protein
LPAPDPAELSELLNILQKPQAQIGTAAPFE